MLSQRSMHLSSNRDSSSSRSNSYSGNRGFTLLEVLVALAIFSICAITLLQQSGRSARQGSQLETKLMASWIADNEVASAQLQIPNIGAQSRQTRFAKLDWEIERQTSKSPQANLFELTIRVSPSGDDQPAHQVRAYVGRY